MNRWCLLFCLVSSVGLVAACGGWDDPAVEARLGALNGNVNFSSGHNCSSAHQSKIRAAMVIAHANLFDSRMDRCLREHYLSGTRGHSVETLLAKMRENESTTIECRNLSGANARAPVNISGEELTFDRTFLTHNTAARVASVLLHEVTHNKGYTHGDSATGADEYRFTIPEQVEQCSLAMSAGTYVASYGVGSVANGHGLAFGELARATHLSPVGELGGVPQKLQCGSSRFARGLYGRAGAKIDRVGLLCATSGGSTAAATGTMGGSGGSSFSSSCAPGQLMVGVHGRARVEVDSIAPVCKTPAQIRTGGHGGTWLAQRGGSGGYAFRRVCPDGMAINRVYGRAGARVDRLHFHCQSIDDTSLPYTSTLTSSGNQAARRWRKECPAGSAMTAITGRAGSRIDRLGGLCTQYRTYPSVALTGVQGVLLEAQGGWGGSVITTSGGRCPASMALIGLRIGAGSRIDSVQGYCANVVQWSNASLPESSVSKRWLTRQGGSGGTRVTKTCPRRYFIGGWKISESGGRVSSLQPICVRR